ncbi:hypothetical protein ACTXT7_009196 [Hymenolepis weldensis]
MAHYKCYCLFKRPSLETCTESGINPGNDILSCVFSTVLVIYKNSLAIVEIAINRQDLIVMHPSACLSIHR